MAVLIRGHIEVTSKDILKKALDPVNKKISDLIIDCEIGWESIAMYYLYSKHCSFKGHYAVDHKIIEQSITEIASLTNFKPTFVELENKYTGLF
ncbi:hypothetical protein ACEV8P_18620 [Vibrio parahaemolyticus]